MDGQILKDVDTGVANVFYIDSCYILMSIGATLSASYVPRKINMGMIYIIHETGNLRVVWVGRGGPLQTDFRRSNDHCVLWALDNGCLLAHMFKIRKDSSDTDGVLTDYVTTWKAGSLRLPLNFGRKQQADEAALMELSRLQLKLRF